MYQESHHETNPEEALNHKNSISDMHQYNEVVSAGERLHTSVRSVLSIKHHNKGIYGSSQSGMHREMLLGLIIPLKCNTNLDDA